MQLSIQHNLFSSSHKVFLRAVLRALLVLHGYVCFRVRPFSYVSFHSVFLQRSRMGSRINYKAERLSSLLTVEIFRRMQITPFALELSAETTKDAETALQFCQFWSQAINKFSDP